MKKARKGRTLLLHPLIFAIYPILSLYAHNMDEAEPSDLAKPLVVALAGVVVLLLAARAVIRDRIKAAIAVTALVVMFFSYGHVFSLLRFATIGGHSLARSLWLFPIWVVVAAMAVSLVVRTRRELRDLTQFLNLAGIILLALAVTQIGAYAMRPNRVRNDLGSRHALHITDKSTLPDIYFIVLDAYSRADVLASHYGYDNTPFTEWLQGKGFYVASKSNSNYMLTRLSIPAALNFDYIDTLAREAGVRHLDGRALYDLLAKPRVVQMLKKAGYRYVFAPSGYGYALTEQPLADVTLKARAIEMTEFDNVLWHTTMLRLTESAQRLTNPWARRHQENTLYSLDRLAKVPEMDGPTFTFAHITITHPPFVFDAEGNPRNDNRDTYSLDEKEYHRLYLDSITYANKRVVEIVDAILSKSARPPVIILQADHGSRLGTGSSIINACYLPDGGDALFYETISPVNTFRAVFNHYFGTDYEFLPDKTYAHEISRDRVTFTCISE